MLTEKQRTMLETMNNEQIKRNKFVNITIEQVNRRIKREEKKEEKKIEQSVFYQSTKKSIKIGMLTILDATERIIQWYKEGMIAYSEANTMIKLLAKTKVN